MTNNVIILKLKAKNHGGETCLQTRSYYHKQTWFHCFQLLLWVAVVCSRDNPLICGIWWSCHTVKEPINKSINKYCTNPINSSHSVTCDWWGKFWFCCFTREGVTPKEISLKWWWSLGCRWVTHCKVSPLSVDIERLRWGKKSDFCYNKSPILHFFRLTWKFYHRPLWPVTTQNFVDFGSLWYVTNELIILVQYTLICLCCMITKMALSSRN